MLFVCLKHTTSTAVREYLMRLRNSNTSMHNIGSLKRETPAKQYSPRVMVPSTPIGSHFVSQHHRDAGSGHNRSYSTLSTLVHVACVSVLKTLGMFYIYIYIRKWGKVRVPFFGEHDTDTK